MMRTLFWILLLGNVIFFATMRWGGLQAGDQQATSAQPALHEEKIRLLDMRQSTATPPEPASAATISESAATACLEWGDFSGADLARATAALSALQLGDKLSQRQIEYNIGYWVYIPPLRNKAAVNRKIAELKALGVTEYFVVQVSGRWHNAISLGVFKSQDAAQNFLSYLRTKGVHTAKVGERASKLKTTLFKLNRIDAPTVAKVTAMQKDFAGSELKNVPCTISGIH